MATEIKALGTFRNERRLPGGLVRRGQTAVVEDDYAEELVDGGKAEIIDQDPDTDATAEQVAEDQENAEEVGSGLPEEIPKRSALLRAGIETVEDARFMAENGDLTNVRGIGPAYADRISSFLEDLDQ